MKKTWPLSRRKTRRSCHLSSTWENREVENALLSQYAVRTGFLMQSQILWMWHLTKHWSHGISINLNVQAEVILTKENRSVVRIFHLWSLFTDVTIHGQMLDNSSCSCHIWVVQIMRHTFSRKGEQIKFHWSFVSFKSHMIMSPWVPQQCYICNNLNLKDNFTLLKCWCKTVQTCLFIY